MAWSFLLNDCIFKQNYKMETRRRNRNENLWEEGETEVREQEKALQWHADRAGRRRGWASRITRAEPTHL